MKNRKRMTRRQIQGQKMKMRNILLEKILAMKKMRSRENCKSGLKSRRKLWKEKKDR